MGLGETFPDTLHSNITPSILGNLPSWQCSGSTVIDIVAESGYLLTPNFPNNYPNRALCTWRIRLPDMVSLRVIHNTEILD